MSRQRFFIAVLGWLVSCSFAAAQLPSVIYTWSGTGNTRGWEWATPDNTIYNFSTLSNTTAGELTITEVGDEFDQGCSAVACPNHYGRASLIRDNGDLIRETSTAGGGLDLTGLQYVEMDIKHNGTGNVSIQPFIGTGFDSTYTWFGPAPDYTPSGGAWTIPAGNTPTTVRIPIYALTPAQQAYNRQIGFKAFDHIDQGYLTWTISEVRSVGSQPIHRTLASHNVGSSDNGLNGVIGNFELGAIAGNDGGQNQTGLSQNTSGSGSLQWTDKGTSTSAVSGAAISWGNGTGFNPTYPNNTFFERPSDFSGYNHVTVRMSATDPLNAGGTLGVQAFMQTGNYEFFRTTSGGTVNQFGGNNLPIDGQFYDLIFPLSSIAMSERQVVMAFGINLFSHTNDLVINVDSVDFSYVAGVPGDYNGNGVVDAGDYVVLRKNGPLQSEIADLGTDTVNDYTQWRARFGNNVATPGSGSLEGGAVPEPAIMGLVAMALVAQLSLGMRRRHFRRA
jgi:hypothetical protein